METSHSFLVAQDGSGGSVSITESVICHFKLRNCLLTRKQVMNLSPPLLKFVEQHHLTLNQIFNCDETGLNFRLLPDKTLASSFEKSADGRKKVKRELQLGNCKRRKRNWKWKLEMERSSFTLSLHAPGSTRAQTARLFQVSLGPIYL